MFANPGTVVPSGWSCYSRCAVIIIFFFIQGQLALLHNLFKAALYDDDLSRVREKLRPPKTKLKCLHMFWVCPKDIWWPFYVRRQCCISIYFCCSGLYQRASSRCLLLWGPTDKALVQGKYYHVLNSGSYFSSFFMSIFQFPESVGPCLRCTAASRPAEGAVGLVYRPVI